MAEIEVAPLSHDLVDRFATMVVAYYKDDPGGLPMTRARAVRQAGWILACQRYDAAPPELPAAWGRRVGAWVLREKNTGVGGATPSSPGTGEILGYALLVAYFSNEFGGPIVYLDELYVVPAARGRGVAGSFLGWLEAWCRREGILRVELEVHDGNTPAARLYTRHGYLREERGLYAVQFTLPAGGENQGAENQGGEHG